MAESKSFANNLNRFKLAAGGARQYEKELPKLATQHAESLTAATTQLEALNLEQEAAKKRLKEITAQMKKLTASAKATRGKLIKLAEGTFGARAAEMDQFRPTTEGKVRKAKKVAA